MNTRFFVPFLLLTLAACDDTEPVPTGKAPPPISGGTLLVTDDGRHVVAADVDRDRVWIVDVDKRRVVHEIALEEGDEPGRIAEDGDGRVHVALRQTHAVVTIDIATGEVLRRQTVCVSPRGVTYEASRDAIHVACMSGQLVTLAVSDGAELRRITLDRDLRDVVVHDDGLWLTRFKTAEVMRLDALGDVQRHNALPSMNDGRLFKPTVAWRMRPLPGGRGAVVAHQRAVVDPVPLSPPGSAPPAYYATGPSTPPGIVHTVVSVIRPIDDVGTDPPPEMGGPVVPLSTLPVDIAVSPDGSQVALAAAGAGTVITLPLHAAETQGVVDASRTPAGGQPVAVAYAPSGELWVQTRNPAAVRVLKGTAIALGPDVPPTAADAAHDMFHLAQGDLGSMSCASCHPEGHDDGHVWSFMPIDGIVPMLRRTQSMRGGLTEGPYHWDGSLPDFDALVQEVMVARMGATDPGPGRIAELADWLIDLEPLPAGTRYAADAVERGRVIFDDETTACASCHDGPKLTNDETVDVGTGEPLQVPTLVGVANHAPFMHDGCAATLRDRFGPCGGGDAHGKTSHLSEAELSDLIAYLESL